MNDQTPFVDLTFRERAVLRLRAAGYTASEIGARLSISPGTVESIGAKLCATSHRTTELRPLMGERGHIACTSRTERG